MVKFLFRFGLMVSLGISAPAFSQVDPQDDLRIPEELRAIEALEIRDAIAAAPQHVRDLFAEHLRVFPNSFPHEFIIFFRDPTQVTQDQWNLASALHKKKGFKEDLKRVRGPLLDFKVTVNEAYEVMGATRFNDRALGDWAAGLCSEIRRLESAFETEKRIAAMIRLIVKKWELPPEERAKDLQLHRMLGALVFYLKLTNNGKVTANFEGTWRDRVSEGFLDYLVEKEAFELPLRLIADTLPEDQRETFREWAEGRLKALHQWTRETFTAPPEQTHVQAGTRLYIREVHPDLAVLRGFVGNDCSTDVSFGFPYSPYERVYYILDAKKNVLGYASGSLVVTEGKRTMFFHTIAGPEITSAQSDLIMRTLYAKRKKIGVDRIVLPEDHRIDDNINFAPILSTMMAVVAGKEKILVGWPDAKYRKIIYRHGSDQFYDAPERNRLGRLLKLDTRPIRVSVSKTPFTPTDFSLFSETGKPRQKKKKKRGGGCRSLL